MRYIDKRLPIFESMGGVKPIAWIDPQNIVVLEQDGDWLKIETWLGEKWVNIEYMPPNNELYNAIKKYSGRASVYYENLETGYSYGYYPDKVYFAASVIKAPYCLYVYDLAENGKADLNTVHTYKSGEYRGGTGVIKNMKIGTTFTEHELLKYAIRNIDNIALAKLVGKYETAPFKDFVKELGTNADNIRTVAGANMSAREAGIFAKAIHAYIESDGEYSQQFKMDLMNTTNPMIISDFPIARKYGWADNYFHDMAIVYSSSPYVLVIMSTGSNFAMFRDISMAVQGFNEKYFSY